MQDYALHSVVMFFYSPLSLTVPESLFHDSDILEEKKSHICRMSFNFGLCDVSLQLNLGYAFLTGNSQK